MDADLRYGHIARMIHAQTVSLFSHRHTTVFSIAAERLIGDRKPWHRCYDTRLDFAAGDQLPQSRLHKYAVIWLNAVGVQRRKSHESNHRLYRSTNYQQRPMTLPRSASPR